MQRALQITKCPNIHDAGGRAYLHHNCEWRLVDITGPRLRTRLVFSVLRILGTTAESVAQKRSQASRHTQHALTNMTVENY